MIVTRIGPLSCAKLSGTLNAAIGLIIGALVSIVALAGGFAANTSETRGLGALIGVGAVIILPICYGAIGFLATLVGAWLYNVLAGVVGGIEVDLR